MNPLAISLGGASIRHASRARRGRFERGWTTTESVRLAIEEVTPEPQNGRQRLIFDPLIGLDSLADFAWWLLIAPGAGRHLFGGLGPPLAAADDPQYRTPFPPGDARCPDIEDIFFVIHWGWRGWCDFTRRETNDGYDRAIATLGCHPYFQAGPAIGFDTPAYRLLKTLLFHHLFWLRRVRDWIPPVGDAFACLSDLFAHLFFRYDVAQWLDPREGPSGREWDDPNWLTLVVFTGRGGSLHEGLAYLCMDQRGQPLLTRRGVRHFTDAPRELPFWDTVRYALILASGGDLAATHDFQAFGDRIPLMFAAPVVRALAPWLAQNREGISLGMGVLMIHWAHAKYREFRRRQPDAHVNAPQRTRPRALTIQRRSARSVIAEILTNLTDFRNPLCKHMVYHTWPSHGWDRTLKIADAEWTVRELCTVGDLAREGQEMNHCAIQCLAACATGETVLVSVASARGNRVTLQVCPWTLNLLQIRGPGNRDPFPDERAATDAWRGEIQCAVSSGG